MITKIINSVALIFALFSCQAQAAWELDLKYDPTPGYNRIIYKIVRWDENDDTRSPLLGCLNPMGPNLTHDCVVAIGYAGGSVGWGWFGSISLKEMDTARTVGELAKVFREKGLLNNEKTYWTSIPAGGEYCFELQYHRQGWRGIMPGGVLSCSRLELLPTYCSISDLYIELDHGAIGANSVNGHTVSKPFRASCNTNYKVRIMSSDSSGVLPLGGGLQSQLKVNGVDLGTGYVDTVGPGGKLFTLTSTLSGYSSGTGSFQGSKVIILSLP